MAMDDVVIILNDKQLRKLAKVVYYKEIDAIHSINFKSEPERAKYLRDCKECNQTSLDLLNLINGTGAGSARADELDRCKSTHGDVKDCKAPIAHDIFSYVKRGVNFALQAVRNYTLRVDYLRKIKEHSYALIHELNHVGDLKSVQKLAKEATQYKNAMLENTKRLQKGASRLFSKMLKEEGISFEQLVKRYQDKLGFKGSFTNLEQVQKLQVYEKIIEASGRGKAIVNKLTTGLGVVGIAVLLFTSGMIVWDIYSSEHKLETAVRDVVEVASAVGGAMLGQVAAAALAARLPFVAIGVSTAFVTITGVILGFVGAFIIGLFTSWLVDLIFRSGGTETCGTNQDRLHCYVAPLPDGLALARQIAHQDRFKN